MQIKHTVKMDTHSQETTSGSTKQPGKSNAKSAIRKLQTDGMPNGLKTQNSESISAISQRNTTGEVKKILSLFDYTGNFVKPYHEAGYTTLQIDIKHGDNVFDIDREWVRKNGPFHGILAAPPCDNFSVSGARWFAEKDADGRTAESVRLVNHTLDIIDWCKPRWWVLENPVGRIARLCPRLQRYGPWYFHPHNYGGWLNPPGDHYTKKSGLYGLFVRPVHRNVEPVMLTDSKGNRGSWMWLKLGGRSARTKELRSATPLGFAKAFFASNP